MICVTYFAIIDKRRGIWIWALNQIVEAQEGKKHCIDAPIYLPIKEKKKTHMSISSSFELQIVAHFSNMPFILGAHEFPIPIVS